jgi:hypothetical protein
MIKNTITFLCIAYITTIDAQNYFKPVPPTGLPYIVIIDTIVTNGISLPAHSEIGIFDDTICVGANEIVFKFPLSIVTWEGAEQYGLDGFSRGDSIKAKIYLPYEKDTLLLDIRPEYIQGDGTFGYGLYSEITINLTITSIVQMNDEKSLSDFSLYPNPSNSGVRIVFPALPGEKKIIIYDLLGRQIYWDSIDSFIDTYYWRCITESQMPVSSGTYIIVVISDDKRIAKKFVLLK